MELIHNELRIGTINSDEELAAVPIPQMFEKVQTNSLYGSSV